jgi:hypothetical protein
MTISWSRSRINVSMEWIVEFLEKVGEMEEKQSRGVSS